MTGKLSFLANEHEIQFPNLYPKKLEEGIKQVPTFITKILKYLEKEGTKKEGIFRISPENNKLSIFETQLNSNLDQFELPDDPHIAATVLKRWLQCFDPPICGNNLRYQKIISSIKNDKFSELNKTLSDFSSIKKSILHQLVTTLRSFLDPLVVSQTKMDAKNISVILAPTILADFNLDQNQTLDNNNYEKDFFLYLLLVLDLSLLK